MIEMFSIFDLNFRKKTFNVLFLKFRSDMLSAGTKVATCKDRFVATCNDRFSLIELEGKKLLWSK